jgi:hypothetical protein
MPIDPRKAVAHIDAVMAHNRGFGGTGAISEVSALMVACIKRWSPHGSSYQAQDGLEHFAPDSKARQNAAKAIEFARPPERRGPSPT